MQTRGEWRWPRALVADILLTFMFMFKEANGDRTVEDLLAAGLISAEEVELLSDFPRPGQVCAWNRTVCRADATRRRSFVRTSLRTSHRAPLPQVVVAWLFRHVIESQDELKGAYGNVFFSPVCMEFFKMRACFGEAHQYVGVQIPMPYVVFLTWVVSVAARRPDASRKRARLASVTHGVR